MRRFLKKEFCKYLIVLCFPLIKVTPYMMLVIYRNHKGILGFINLHGLYPGFEIHMPKTKEQMFG